MLRQACTCEGHQCWTAYTLRICWQIFDSKVSAAMTSVGSEGTAAECPEPPRHGDPDIISQLLMAGAHPHASERRQKLVQIWPTLRHLGAGTPEVSSSSSAGILRACTAHGHAAC